MGAPRYLAVVAAAFVLAAAAGAVTLLRGAEVPFLGALVERRASDALGRAVTLDSPPWVKLGAMVELRVTGISLANSDWAGPEPLVLLDKAEAALELSSLFSGPVLIERLIVDGLRVNLATDADGRSNLPSLAPDAADKEEDAGLPFVLRTATVGDARLRRRDGRSGQQLDLRLESFTQVEADDGRLSLQGAGTLQDRAWRLTARHSGLRSLLDGRDLSGTVEGSLGDLHLEGEYRLPDVQRPEDLVVEAELTGEVPPKVAALSPLLETADPLRIQLRTTDIDPGISLDVLVDIGDLDVSLRGIMDNPGQGDGFDLTIDANAGSLPRLARALDLGATDEVPLVLDGRVRRKGRRLEIDDFLARAGDHRIEGTIRLPLLPGTTGAELDLHATGPDYSFYQRLLRRPFELHAPYTLDLVVNGTADGRERVDATLNLGSATLAASGFLGDFPEYTGSELSISVAGDDLGLVGRLIERDLPAITFSIAGDVAVSEAGRVTTKGVTASVADAELTVTGGLNTYPALDALDATARLNVPSLAATGAQLGLQGLGDVPASLTLSTTGAAREIDVADIAIAVGESEARRIAGALHVGPAGLTSDLRLGVVLAQLPTILGDLAPQGMPAPRLEFTLAPRVEQESYEVLIEDLRGPQLTGAARLSIGRQLAVDDRASLSAELLLEDPAALLPTTPAFTPPSSPLQLQIAMRGGDQLRLDASLSRNDVALLSSKALPADANGPVRLRFGGKGSEIRALGSSPYLPPGPLPYEVRGSATIAPQDVTVSLDSLEIGDSDLSGAVSIDRDDGALRASLASQRMNLPPWLQAVRQSRETDDTVQPHPENSQRLIPDVALPTALLDGPALDITLATGALGITDPRHATRSLVDRSRVHFERGNGGVNLRITELEGSRGSWTLDLEAERVEEGARVRGEMRAQEVPLGIITLGAYDSLPRHSLEVSLTAAGSTLRDLAADFDGDFLLVGGSGTLPKTNASLVTESFIEQLLLTLMPALKNQQPDMEVECTVLGARARQGQVALDPGFVMRTERVDLSARGEVDLVRERLAIRFDNQARRGLGISAASLVNPYVQITGTLKRPTLGLDVAGSAIAGGAAVATGGLTVLARPLFGRFLSRNDPCAAALERWKDTAS